MEGRMARGDENSTLDHIEYPRILRAPSNYPNVLSARDFTGSVESQDGTKVGGNGAHEALLF